MKLCFKSDLCQGRGPLLVGGRYLPRMVNAPEQSNKLYIQLARLLPILFLFSIFNSGQAQNTGCLPGRFGVDGGLYSNVIEFGAGSPALNSVDWFYRAVSGGTGQGVIDTSMRASFQTQLQGSGNPLLEARMSSGLYSTIQNQIRIDAVFGRDMFGGLDGLIKLPSRQPVKTVKTPQSGIRDPKTYWAKTTSLMLRGICSAMEQIW